MNKFVFYIEYEIIILPGIRGFTYYDLRKYFIQKGFACFTCRDTMFDVVLRDGSFKK